MNKRYSPMRNEFNQQANRAITANNGDINCELAGDTNVRFLALNLAGSYDRFWPGADPRPRHTTGRFSWLPPYGTIS